MRGKPEFGWIKLAVTLVGFSLVANASCQTSRNEIIQEKEPGKFSIASPSRESGTLTRDDKDRIIKACLEIALLHGKIPDSHFLKNENTLYLSTKNIEPGWIPAKLDKINLIFLNPDQIPEEIEKKGRLQYLQFSRILYREIWGQITLEVFRKSFKDGKIRGSGSGLKIEFVKKQDRTLEGSIKSVHYYN